jgi:hypothetical protein
MKSGVAEKLETRNQKSESRRKVEWQIGSSPLLFDSDFGFRASGFYLCPSGALSPASASCSGTRTRPPSASSASPCPHPRTCGTLIAIIRLLGSRVLQQPRRSGRTMALSIYRSDAFVFCFDFSRFTPRILSHLLRSMRSGCPVRRISRVNDQPARSSSRISRLVHRLARDSVDNLTAGTVEITDQKIFVKLTLGSSTIKV